MRSLLRFALHKFSPRQSALIIGASIVVAFAVHLASEAAGLSPAAVNAAGITAAFATFAPMQIVFYRRAHA